MPSFKDLKIYQESIRLMLEIKGLCRKLPLDEKYRLGDAEVGFDFFDLRGYICQ